MRHFYPNLILGIVTFPLLLVDGSVSLSLSLVRPSLLQPRDSSAAMDKDERRPLFKDALTDDDEMLSSSSPYKGDDFEVNKKGCCKRCCSMKALAILSLVMGVIVLAVGLGARPAVDAIMHDVITKDAVMDSSDALFYTTWESSKKVRPLFSLFSLSRSYVAYGLPLCPLKR